MKGKLILVEGTDSSGKQTQTKLLLARLQKENIKVTRFSFPWYETPTGKIVGGPYLGKTDICESWFKEGAPNVNPKVAALFYAADRLYNIHHITSLLDQGHHVILDRYIPSNLAHQGGKIVDPKERQAMYKWIDDLEYKLLGLPIPDINVLLYMPFSFAKKLRATRPGNYIDAHELSEEHLRNAEKAYLEVAALYDWNIIHCVKDNTLRTIDDIQEELYHIIHKYLHL